MTTVPVSIRMFGPCLATPTQELGEKVEKLSVLTPCCPRSRIATDGETQIDALYTYLIVHKNNLNSATSTRKPDLWQKSGEIDVAVFMFHREEITVVDDPKRKVLLVSDGLPLPDPPPLTTQDVRWIPDLPALLPGATVKPGCVDAANPPAALCTRLVFRSGELSGRFPCGNFEKRNMKHTALPDGYLAQEMIVSLETQGTLTLRCTPFDSGKETNDIVLEAPGAIPFHVFLATGPLINLLEMADFNPCVPTNEQHNGHAAGEADYEFETLWDLFEVPLNAPLPVPQIPAVHGPRQDCVPGRA